MKEYDKPLIFGVPLFVWIGLIGIILYFIFEWDLRKRRKNEAKDREDH